MKHYNIKPVKKSFSWGEMDVVALGEEGRGRKLTLVPYHAPKDAEFLALGATRSGKVKIIKSDSSDGAWLAVVSGSGVYTRGTYGTVYAGTEDVGNGKLVVIAAGYGAYGIAGRIGSWNEFLVVAKDGVWLRIRPAGGSHKIPSYWLYFGLDKVHRIDDEELELFLESHPSVTEPPNEDTLLDLSGLDVVKDIETINAILAGN